MSRMLVVAACCVFLVLAIEACHSEPAAESAQLSVAAPQKEAVPAAESATLSVAEPRNTAAPAAFRNLGKRAESQS